MISHLIRREQCVNALDVTLREKILEQERNERTKTFILKRSSDPTVTGGTTAAEPSQPRHQDGDSLETDPHTVQEVVKWDPVTELKAARRALNKERMAYEEMAKRNPLYKKCRTCPICSKSFQGHKQMIRHLTMREQCVSALDVTLHEKLLEKERNERTKSERRKVRRRGTYLVTR